MKKLLLSAIALAAFSSANAQLSESGRIYGYTDIPPKEFCYDGKVKLVMKESSYMDSIDIFKIYNDNFEVEKTINLDLGYQGYHESLQRREEGTPISSSYSYAYADYYETWEEAKEIFISELDCTEKEGYQLWPNHESYYYDFEKYGKTYPLRYYYWNQENKTIYERICNYEKSYTGDWYTYENRNGSEKIEPLYYLYINYDNGSDALGGFDISQTLFNKDDKYEALVYKYSQNEVISDERDVDGDGEIDHRTISVGGQPNGFSIVSEDGTELYNFVCNDLDRASIYIESLSKINNKYYFRVKVYNGEDYNIFLEINRETSSIKQVAKLKGMRVSPTIAEQTDNITVELGEGSNAKEIVVVNGNGQVVKQIPVKNGERQITINAGSLNRGLNILNARGAKGNNNCKIIVK